MTEPFSYEDTQFVAETINRETIEQAHAILTGLIERGWTPPPATGGIVTGLPRVGERDGCGYALTAADLKNFRDRLLADTSEATIAAIRQIKGVASVEPVNATYELHIAEDRVRRELIEKVWKALNERPQS